MQLVEFLVVLCHCLICNRSVVCEFAKVAVKEMVKLKCLEACHQLHENCSCCRLSVSKQSGRVKWCVEFEDRRRHRVLKIMLAITFCLLPTAVICIGLLKYSSSPQKGLPHIPRAENYDDMREHADHDFLQDYKTSCIPTTSQYLISIRKRRDLLKTFYQQQYRAHNGNLSDIVIWDTSRKQDNSVQFMPVGTSSNNIKKESKKNTATGFTRMNSTLMDNQLQENKNLEGSANSKQDLDIHSPLEDFELDYYGSGADRKEIPQGEDLFSILYDEGNGGKNEDFPWDKSEHQEEDKNEKDPISEHIMADDAYIQQHAFWKGEGDKKTIRETQGKLMKQYMDFSVDPCEDFYQYSCGNWGKLNPIPKDKAAFDTFEMLRESLDAILKELLEKKISPNENEAYVKAKYLYKSCMNNDILERRKEKPLIDLLNSLGGWPIICPNWDESNFDWLVLMARLRLYNNDILISEWVGPDIKNSDEYVIQFDQTSLGLPTRDYYLHASNSIYLNAYRVYLIKIATLLGASSETASIQAYEIVDFETALAKITSAPDERRNVSELYQRMTVGQLHSLVPQIDWIKYLTIVLGRPCNESEPVVIFALRYVQDLVGLLGRTEPKTISNYLLWRFVRHRVNNLDDRFQDAKQKFYYILFGREKSPPRWKNCVAQVNSNLGMAMGAMFVQKYFDENSKNDTLVMTKEIQLAFKEILKMTNWIDNDTKTLAAEKVESMMLRIGYPDFILDREQLKNRYRDVDIQPDKYFENTLNILQHLTRVEQANLGCAVNKTVWNTAPAVVNAYYSRNKNQIMVPAGILQPPFYHRYFPRSLNYGGIGVVIGHEITHGFDDKGRLFDKHGNLHRWWKDEAINNFHERAQCLIDQYSKYIVQEVGIQIDGTNTQGENIADNGGIKQAFRAYKRWLSTHSNADETLPGLNFTGMQLFYLNFAQVWCGSTRPEATRNKLKTSVHSPGKFRVIGTLSNSKDFSEVFNCPPGSPMNPTSKCTVW